MTDTGSPQMPAGWTQTALGELVTVLRGISYKGSDARQAPGQGLVPILRANNIDGELMFEDLVYIPTHYVSDEQLLRSGDIVVAASSGSRSVVGKAALLRNDWVGSFGAFCFALRPVPDINAALIAAFLQTKEYRNRVSELAAGVNINNLRRQHIEGIPVRLPPCNEQDRIVAAIETQFTRLDAAVAALQRARANLKRYRAAVLKAAVEGRLVPTEAELARAEGRGYEPAEALIARVLDEHRTGWRQNASARRRTDGKVLPDEPSLFESKNSPSLPSGWTSVKLGAMLHEPLRNGHSAKASPAGSGGVRTLTLTAVTRGDFSEANTKLTVARPEDVSDLWLKPGDIFIERSNTPDLVGTAARYTGSASFAIFPDLLIRARLVPSISDRYVELFLLSEQARSYFRQKAQGIAGSMPKVDQATVANLAVPLPPRSEQERIADEAERGLTVLKELEVTIDHGLKRAERLRQAILKRAFEGKLVPQDPDDEPADVLLERIREAGAASPPARRRGAQRGRKMPAVQGTLAL